ncbi:hypothetical protein L1987_34085 [Smallanthus sonchifolius]|uniref:Uncharacterized protein n=1 Tax=Smallanthus sonchifolius TaxID=185202 RepID=A0ACB9HUC4_9ASTR|nr:hypothetical protein L1987_34085 [Smallanthus sonchifolius]
MTVGSSIVELGRGLLGILGGVKKAVALCGNDDGKVDTVDSSTVELRRTLLTIRGGGGKMRRKYMPLHAAALYGKYDVVKYIFDHAVTNFGEVGWDEFNRDRFLDKCVEYDMFGKHFSEVVECVLYSAKKSTCFLVLSFTVVSFSLTKQLWNPFQILH